MPTYSFRLEKSSGFCHPRAFQLAPDSLAATIGVKSAAYSMGRCRFTESLPEILTSLTRSRYSTKLLLVTTEANMGGVIESARGKKSEEPSCGPEACPKAGAQQEEALVASSQGSKTFDQDASGRTAGCSLLSRKPTAAGPFQLLYGIVMPLLHAAFLSDAEHCDLLAKAGFTEVTTKHVSGKNWICATGRRPTT